MTRSGDCNDKFPSAVWGEKTPPRSLHVVSYAGLLSFLVEVGFGILEEGS